MPAKGWINTNAIVRISVPTTTFGLAKVCGFRYFKPTLVPRRRCGVNIEQAQLVRFPADRLCLSRMFNH